MTERLEGIQGIRRKAEEAIQQIETKYEKTHQVSKEDLATFHETIKSTLKDIETTRGLKQGTITQHFKNKDISQVLEAAKKVLTNKDDLAIVGALQTIIHKLPPGNHDVRIDEVKYRVDETKKEERL